LSEAIHDNYFNIESPDEWFATVVEYHRSHRLMVIEIRHWRDQLRLTQVIYFSQVLYFSGFISWTGANFKVYPNSECLRLWRLFRDSRMEQFLDNVGISEEEFVKDTFKLYVVESAPPSIQILAASSGVYKR
jgi:hypothetical protein